MLCKQFKELTGNIHIDCQGCLYLGFEEGWVTIFNKYMNVRDEKGESSIRLRGLFGQTDVSQIYSFENDSFLQ